MRVGDDRPSRRNNAVARIRRHCPVPTEKLRQSLDRIVFDRKNREDHHRRRYPVVHNELRHTILVKVCHLQNRPYEHEIQRQPPVFSEKIRVVNFRVLCPLPGLDRRNPVLLRRFFRWRFHLYHGFLRSLRLVRYLRRLPAPGEQQRCKKQPRDPFFPHFPFLL